MNSFDRHTGRPQWSVNLVGAGRRRGSRMRLLGEPAVVRRPRSSRPPAAPAAAWSRSTRPSGEIAWQSQDFQNGYSSPLLIDLDGQPEVVVFTYGEVSGLNPRTGALEWTVAHASDQGVNVATPVWGSDHLLFVSSAYNGGSRVLRLSRRHGNASTSKKCGQIGASASTSATPSAIGNRIYASNGTSVRRRLRRSTSRPATWSGATAASRARRSSASGDKLLISRRRRHARRSPPPATPASSSTPKPACSAPAPGRRPRSAARRSTCATSNRLSRSSLAGIRAHAYASRSPPRAANDQHHRSLLKSCTLRGGCATRWCGRPDWRARCSTGRPSSGCTRRSRRPWPKSPAA